MPLNFKKGVYTPKKREASKNVEAFQEIADAFKGLAMGEYIEVSNEDVKSSVIEAGIRDFIKVDAGEHIKLSRVKELVNGKQTTIAVRIVKSVPPQPKKPKVAPAQGTV